MQLDQLTGNDLIKFLPHRGRNLLLDTVDRSESPKGPQAEISLHIKQPDEKKREIFLEKDLSGETIYSPYMFAEFLALGSIVLLTDLPPESMAYFSTITNYKRTGSVSANGAIHGSTIRNKDRGLFKRFTGKITDANGNEAAQTDIMAFAFTPEMEAASREEKKITEKPLFEKISDIDKTKFDWKPNEMVFTDAIGSIDLDNGNATTHYIYPEDHPFVEGHFPGNPIMMGITQWEGCADAMTCLAQQLIEQDHTSITGKEIFEATANIEVVKEDGTLACDVKGLTLKFTNRGKDNIPVAELVATKRVGFRDMVRPKDNLYFQVTSFQIQS